MNRFCFVFIFLLAYSKAGAHSDAFWKSIETDFVSMELTYLNNPSVESRYPALARFFLESFWGWNPGTTWDMSTSCDLDQFKTNLVLEQTPVKKQLVVTKFLRRCSPIYSKNNMLNGLKIISQKGSFENHPFFKYSFLNFPDKVKTRALWGFKTQSKRDLVIIRPGIFASVDELIAEKYLLYILTELNNFHVVVLENSTSGDHIVNNEHGMIGGPKEAFENLYLVDQIRKNKTLAALVDKVHLLGISLGANGVLLSSLVNQKQNYRYFDKTLLLCPVVDLKASFQAQMANGWTPYLLDWWSSYRFKDLAKKKDFQLESAVDSLLSLSPRWVNGVWMWLEKKYLYRASWQLYLSKDFYTGQFKNDYQFFSNQTMLPMQLFVLATEVDPIVVPEMNFDRLSKHANEHTFFAKFENGIHCSFAYTYQWKFLDRFLSGLLESSTKKRNEGLASIGAKYQVESIMPFKNFNRSKFRLFLSH